MAPITWCVFDVRLMALKELTINLLETADADVEIYISLIEISYVDICEISRCFATFRRLCFKIT